MMNIVTNLRRAALISFVLVLPFAILEFLNNTITSGNVLGVIVLFGLLWLLPVAFIVILSPMVRSEASKRAQANPAKLLIRVACLVLIATAWGSILIDQLPCFMGVPNCD